MAIVISGVNNNDKITASDGTIDLLSECPKGKWNETYFTSDEW